MGDIGARTIEAGPANCVIGPVKKGPSIDKVLFSAPSYNAIGEPFKEASKMNVGLKNHVDLERAGHERAFRPAKQVRQPDNASYEHQQDRVHKMKNFRSEENPRDILVGPANIKTNPTKGGQSGRQVYFGGAIPYIEDDYNRPKLLKQKDDEYHKSKLQEAPFRQRVGKIEYFNSHKKILEEEPRMPAKKMRERTAPHAEHERPFRPSHPPRTGYNKTIASFPEYQYDPPRQIKRVVKDPAAEEPAKFKPTHNVKSRPTPSVQTNLRNLKASFPSVFKR